MVSTEAGFGTCQGPVQSVCQPPVLPKTCSLPRQPQHLTNPELASDAKCSYFSVALLQEIGSLSCPHLKNPLCASQGAPHKPQKQKEGEEMDALCRSA